MAVFLTPPPATGSGGGPEDIDGEAIAPSTVTIGTGDAQQYAVATAGQKLMIKSGTAASPDTSLNPLVKVERTMNVSDDAIAGDGVEQCASIVGITVGTSASEVQPVGLAGFAATSSAAAGDNAIGLPDACAVYGVGRITGSGTGSGIGAYFQGRTDSSTGKITGVEIQTYNGTGSDHSVNTTGYSNSQALWINANGGNRSSAGMVIANAFGKQFETGLYFNAQVNNALTGGVATASIRDDSTSATAIAINGTHATAAMRVASGSGPVLLGTSAAQVTAGTLLELTTTTSVVPTAIIHSTGNQAVSLRVSNNSGACHLFSAAGADNQLTGTAAGDGGIKIGTSGKSFHIGGSVSTVEVTFSNELGFFNDATPATKQTVTGSRGGNAALASLLTALAAYGLITDSSS